MGAWSKTKKSNLTNIAVELILATAKHDVEAIGTAAGDIDLGDVWLLPPTLTLQYHFTGGALKPYLGAGFNYTIFYGVDEGPVADAVDYESSFGIAFQGGLDIDLDEKWFLNLDLKKIFIQTEATVDATSALGATVGADVDINPLVIGFGIGTLKSLLFREGFFVVSLRLIPWRFNAC